MCSKNFIIENIVKIVFSLPWRFSSLKMPWFIWTNLKELYENYLNHKAPASKYRVISGPHFSVFGLNTEIYGVISVFSRNTGK